MSADDLTPARRPSSIARIQQWGIVEAWLATETGRHLTVTIGPNGLRVSAVDPNVGERIEDVARDEDPARAILRAIGRMYP